MDDIVKQAMAKWPNVPAVYGWLRLDRRGNWLIKNDRVANPLVADFINRNYAHDALGHWFFQNGPQRVFVALDCAPLVFRTVRARLPAQTPFLEAHTGKRVTQVSSACIDDRGVVLLDTDLGPGMIDDRDLEDLLPWLTGAAGEMLAEEAVGDAIERLQSGGDASLFLRYGGRTTVVAPIRAGEVPQRFGFVAHPVPETGEPECA